MLCMRLATTSFQRILIAGCLILLIGVFARTAFAQEADLVPRLEEAENIFVEALESFDAGDYGAAYQLLRRVYEDYPLHRKTTAAILMGGKALYRGGDYERATVLLSEFIRIHPSSGYVADAERTLGFAQRKLDGPSAASDTIRLGIALPLTSEDTPLTQELFNGIRLAVEAHNRSGTRPVKMVFRDTDNYSSQARRAVTSLVEEGQVDVIVGPLFSGEAEAAAEAAERLGVVMVAPMATEEAVSQGKRYVFQANATFSERGKLMARFAVQGLRLNSFGIVAAPDRGQVAERMAEGFQEEILRLGKEVSFVRILPDTRAWRQLPELVGSDTLASVEAIYMPVGGSNAFRNIDDAMSSMRRLGKVPRILGNSEWDEVSSRERASTLGVTYTHDFYIDEATEEVKSFKQDYYAVVGKMPGRLAYTGYDVAQYLLTNMVNGGDLPLHQKLRAIGVFEGLGTRIDFRDANANEAMFYFRYRNSEMVLLR